MVAAVFKTVEAQFGLGGFNSFPLRHFFLRRFLLPARIAMMRFLALLFFALVSCDRSEPIEPGADQAVWEKPDTEKWAPIQFGGEGAAEWNDGVLHFDPGVEMTGIRYDGPVPTVPFEVRLEARKIEGSDFFCGLTFPVDSHDACATLIVGGWGGGTLGISSIDGMDASENETTSYHNFKDNQWYAIRVRVESDRISTWIDGEELINVGIEGRKIGLRTGSIELCAPFGLAAFQTEAEFKGLEWRSLAD